MFYLNQAIGVWRKEMSAGGITNPSILDELESHLRDDVEQQVRAGNDPEKAFIAAVQKIGPARALKKEFKKSTAANVLEKMMIALAVLFVTFGIFLSTVTVIFCYRTAGERITGFTAMGLSILAGCVWPKFVPRLPVIQEKRKRWMYEIVCLSAGFGIATFYVQVVVTHFARTIDGMLPAMGFWTLIPIAIGFALACGLEQAARRETRQLLA